jgi:hypothetical protein
MVPESHQLYSCWRDLQHHRRRGSRRLGLRSSPQRQRVCNRRNPNRRLGSNHYDGPESGALPGSAVKTSNQSILGHEVVRHPSSCAVGPRLGISIQHKNHIAGRLDADCRRFCLAHACDRGHARSRVLVRSCAPRVVWSASLNFTNVNVLAHCRDLGGETNRAGSCGGVSLRLMRKQSCLEPAIWVAVAQNEMDLVACANNPVFVF